MAAMSDVFCVYWDCVKTKNIPVNILNFHTQDLVHYPMTSSMVSQGACLDNNHSHFILVDDGTVEKYGGEITFRACLEHCISNKKISRSKLLISISNNISS